MPLDSRTSSVASGRAKNRKGTKVVPRPGETCSDAAGPPVEPLRVGPAHVREPELAAPVRDADLAGVEMAGEDEVERRPAGSLSITFGKWQSRMRRSASGSASRSGCEPRRAVGARVDADDLHAPAAQLDGSRLVDEEAVEPSSSDARSASRTGRGCSRSRGCRAPRTSPAGARAACAASARRSAARAGRR